MIKILGNFNCSRCNKPFMSYLFGRYLFGCHEDTICFYDNTLGEIHDNSYVNPIVDKRKLCRQCRKGTDINEFLPIDNRG